MDATLERFRAYVAWCTAPGADDCQRTRETQTAVARRLGVKQPRLSRILAGDRGVDLALAVEIQVATKGWEGGQILASEWVYPEGLPADADDPELPLLAEDDQPRAYTRISDFPPADGPKAFKPFPERVDPAADAELERLGVHLPKGVE